ncbi:chymotrypsin-2-like [Ceratina calcarata]|uniref:Chymotrypsin-2-like n=1 Tax=Ceratina calcarata TaxID=156304 RepID=A0AAJ7NCA7_9HYME|nr:chymotrypsin-2-like [Ceratina calcarata]
MISTRGKCVILVFTGLVLSSNICCVLASTASEIIDDDDVNLNHIENVQDYLINGTFSDEDEFPDMGSVRIVGGEYAQLNQFPFMAIVHQLMGKGVISKCGGSIISSRWVLTAGHCMGSKPRLVVFGVNDKTGIGYNFYRGPGIAMWNEQGVLHPGYSKTVNDIALLYMPQNIPFGENIQPIRLAGFNHGTFAGWRSAVIGWGVDGPTGSGTDSLKYAVLSIISNYACSTYWSITEKHICTAIQNQEACRGDSGGPLVVYIDGMPLQIGIVSYGDGACPSGRPGVFTRVSAFADWIAHNTGLYFY